MLLLTAITALLSAGPAPRSAAPHVRHVRRSIVSDSLNGLSYEIDSTRDPSELGVLPQFAGVVTFAYGRGRLDINAVAAYRPFVRPGVTTAALLAQPGDFYLFDSTSFVLVQPATKTFSVFRLADPSYNFENRRDGWPAYFQFQPEPSVPPRARFDSAVVPQHGSFPVYWHADYAGGGSIARGRVIVVDAPPSDEAVVRWFAITPALAQFPDGLASLHGQSMSVTSVSLWQAPRPSPGPTGIAGKRAFVGLRQARVNPASLTLPADYKESAWPRHEAQILPLSADGGAKWRQPPSQH